MLQLEQQYPDRLYFKADEVAGFMNIPVSTLRFWCGEFSEIEVRKNGKGDRHFTKEDIALLQYIYHLLKEKEYTIEGAKKVLAQKGKQPKTQQAIQKLEDIKFFLKELKKKL